MIFQNRQLTDQHHLFVKILGRVQKGEKQFNLDLLIKNHMASREYVLTNLN